MPHISSLRMVCLIGLLGSVLVIIGFFLPVRLATTTFFGQPPLYSADSFWNMFSNTITSRALLDLPSEIGIGSFLLAILIPLLSSIAVLRDKGKHVAPFFGLGFSTLGCLEVLTFSAFLLGIAGWGGHGIVSMTVTVGPGFWLMLIGFSVCILSSAQCALFWPPITTVKPRTAFESLQEETHFAAPREASSEKES